ncbi:MAG: hypothetical protein HYS27_21775 [Deltaproteobacteria bacterium]|nr:hypothetical protein [Deltaproteobacteria bacterium]
MEPTATPTSFETSGPRLSPPAPLPVTVGALLLLHDRGLLDARTTRAALPLVRRGAHLAEVLERAGVPRSLQEKADELLRPSSTRLDGAAAAALSLVPPALAVLSGELARMSSTAAGVLLAAGLVASVLLGQRRAKAAAAAIATAAAVVLSGCWLSPSAIAGAIVVAVLIAAVAFALRPVRATPRSAATGLLAGAAVEALRAVLA